MNKNFMNIENTVNVYDFGADGTGVADSSEAFALAVLKAKNDKKTLYIPQGRFRIEHTIRIPSDFYIYAEPNARIYLGGERKKQKGDFLLTNDDHENGNVNIHIEGGIWDGNNKGAGNAKPDIFDKNGYSGTVLNFCSVKGLCLKDMVVANSVTYNIRMAKLENFYIDNIAFLSDVPGHNQDGLHFNGEVRHGIARNIRALSYGQTNDDLIAINADDSMERVENLGMVRGAVEDIVFENLYAENCHTIIRLLSVYSPIRNLTFRNVYGGYRCYAINLDGARYCRTPLFSEDEYPAGCGIIENVKIENMVCYPTSESGTPAVFFESLADNFVINNFSIISQSEASPNVTALHAANITETEITADVEKIVFTDKKQSQNTQNFSYLSVNHIKH